MANPKSAESSPRQDYTDSLIRHSATTVKNKWGDIARDARTSKGVAITNHGNVDYVVLTAAAYNAMAEEIADFSERKRKILEEFTARYDQRFEVFKTPEGEAALEAFLKNSLAGKRPKVGEF